MKEKELKIFRIKIDSAANLAQFKRYDEVKELLEEAIELINTEQFKQETGIGQGKETKEIETTIKPWKQITDFG